MMKNILIKFYQTTKKSIIIYFLKIHITFLSINLFK
jgi:hypothetical protein